MYVFLQPVAVAVTVTCDACMYVCMHVSVYECMCFTTQRQTVAVTSDACMSRDVCFVCKHVSIPLQMYVCAFKH